MKMSFKISSILYLPLIEKEHFESNSVKNIPITVSFVFSVHIFFN